MKKCASGAIAVVCALCLTVVAAQATTITFEGVVPANGSALPGTPYTEGGFIVTDPSVNGAVVDGIFGPSSGFNTNGTSVFAWSANSPPFDPTIDVRAVNGATFSLLSLDAAIVDGSDIQQMTVTGSFAGGGTITQLLTLSGTWTTFNLAGFTNLTNVDFTAVLLGDNVNTTVPDPGFDNLNLNVNAAPGPVAGAGLPGMLAGFGAMLAWYRKRRAAV